MHMVLSIRLTQKKKIFKILWAKINSKIQNQNMKKGENIHNTYSESETFFYDFTYIN